MKQTIQKVRDLLADPARWTKHVAARNASGNPVSWNGSQARCWCLQGAILKMATSPDEADAIQRKLDQHLRDARPHFAGLPQLVWAHVQLNDTGSHKGVMDLLDQVLEKL